MNARQLLNQAHIYVEMGQDWLRAVKGMQRLEVPLERLPDGRLTESCKSDLVARLQKFIDRKSWQPQARVYCGIGARGVSLRRLSLPAAGKDEVRRLLPLQIEREFPLSPDQLAWGAQPLNGAKAAQGHSNGKQEFLVAAVKRETLEEYAGIFAASGASALFTLSAADRTHVCPQTSGQYALLSIERTYCELITMEGAVPTAIRVLPRGWSDLMRVSENRLSARGDNMPGAELPPGPVASFGGTASPTKEVVEAEGLDELAALIKSYAVGPRLYITGLGEVPASSDFAGELERRLGPAVQCRAVALPTGDASWAGVLGLQRAFDDHAGCPPLILQLKQVNGRTRIPKREQLQWAGAAAGLLLLALSLPYLEALVLKPHLVNTLAAVKTDQGRLEVIDRELDFLRYLEANDPPYLDTLLVLGKAAPPGTRFDSVSMNRRGEVSLRGSLQNGQQVAELRSKLIASGFFNTVAVEEQTPSPDRQKVTVRMSAQWKALGTRSKPSLDSVAASVEPRPPSGPMPAGPPSAAVNVAPNPRPSPPARQGKD